MIDKGVARRYAVALFAAAEKRGIVDAVLEDLENLEAIVHAPNPRLVRFLSSPQELDEKKYILVETLFRGKATDLFVELIRLLLRKRRILYLLAIAAAYRKQVEEARGIAEAIVTTAVRLPEDLSDGLVEELERMFDKKVKLRPRIDPKIIGGIVVTIEGQIIDRSVRSELEKIRDELLSVPVHQSR